MGIGPDLDLRHGRRPESFRSRRQRPVFSGLPGFQLSTGLGARLQKSAIDSDLGYTGCKPEPNEISRFWTSVLKSLPTHVHSFGSDLVSEEVVLLHGYPLGGCQASDAGRISWR